jgi:hypothetical protein
MSEQIQEVESKLKRAIMFGNYTDAEKALQILKQEGVIAPMQAIQIEQYLQMAKWNVNSDADAKLRAVIATML